MDILPPPKRPALKPTSRPGPHPVVVDARKPAEPEVVTPSAISMPSSRRRFYRRWYFWALVSLGLLILMSLSAIGWYYFSLQPRDRTSDQTAHVLVASGDSSATIIHKLAQAGVIRSELATRLYVEITGVKNKLQAGGYVVSAKQSVSEIIQHIVAGKTDEQLITIPPGRTLKQLRSDLKKYGYSDEDISTAFNASYRSPLLADKPANMSLEGYIFPESFKVSVSAPLSELFERSFDELYSRLARDGLIDTFKARGLNLHEALTLASIVQKEVSNPTDQRQVAQVFYSRLSANMVLGSDVTFAYAADLLGVTPAVDIDSPYNTRLNPGLPPGPIANMNYIALQAIAAPAPGDYLYFVAGDDGKTYYSHTVEEHEANVHAHCHNLCS